MTYLPEARRQLLGAAERRAARRLVIPPLRLAWVAPALSLAVAAAVAIAFLSVRTQPAGRPATRASHQLQLVYLAQPTGQVPVLAHAGLARAVKDLNLRLSQIPHSHASIRIVSGHLIRVDLTTRIALTRVEAVLGSDARLLFYDWEANVLLPSGRSAASGLSGGDASAIKLSQGTGTAAGPGGPAAGAMGLYQAVRLASRQPFAASRDNARIGSEFYLFARHGRGLLAGPLDPGPVSRTQAIRELESGLPRAERRNGRVLVIKQGTVVLQAAPSSFRVAEEFGTPGAGYYVLHDHVALFGSEITNPRAGTDSTGVPDVNFGFTGNGANAFHRLTAGVAHRGELVSTSKRSLFQHFAIALDNQLITVPQIDYTQYPDGVAGGRGADISAGFTRSATRGLVTALRLGALPLKLTLVKESASR